MHLPIPSENSPPRLTPFITAIDLFKDLDQATLDDLESALQWITLTSDEVLVRQGEAGDSMYVLVRGRLGVKLKVDDDREVDLDNLHPEVSVGEMSLLTGQERSTTVYALEPSALVRLSKAGFNRLAAGHPQLLTNYARAVLPRIQRVELAPILTNLFGELDVTTLHDLQAILEWRHLSNGDAVFRQGEPGDAMFIVVSGRLKVVLEQPDGNQGTIGEIGPGEIFGEYALITAEPRMATIYAIRETDIVKLPRTAFEQLSGQYPQLLLHITRLILKRQGKPTHHTRAMTFAVVPISQNVPIADFVSRLQAALGKSGLALHLNRAGFDTLYGQAGAANTPLDHPTNIVLTHWLGEWEKKFQYILYETDQDRSAWTKRCLSQADQILLVGWAGTDPSLSKIEVELLRAENEGSGVQKRLVLLHPETAQWPVGTMQWLKNRQVHKHHHVRWGHKADLERLARFLSGQAVGLVLSGGGARGVAHIGVIRALQEANIPIDLIGGNSMGAVVAANYVLGWNYEMMMEKNRRGLKPLKLLDPTPPLVSMFAGRKRYRTIHREFGDRHIEDLWLPYFCVSSNLTRAELVVHQSGPLWKGVMASTNLAGIMPPVVDNGDFLFDGNLLNDMPVDVMHSLCEGGTVIAVNVSPPIDLERNPDFGPYLSGWRLLWNKINPFADNLKIPDIATILQRAGELSSIAGRRELLQQNLADLYLEPPVAGIALFDFQAIDQIVAIGYEYAKEQIAVWKEEQSNREI